MPRQHHTVIFVPHARAKLRKWRVTNLQIGFAVGLLLTLTSSALFVTWSHFRTEINPAEIARLQRENEDLRRVNTGFETSIRTLQEQLTDYEDRTRQLAIVAGLESLGESGEAGVGGDAPGDAAEPFAPAADAGDLGSVREAAAAPLVADAEDVGDVEASPSPGTAGIAEVAALEDRAGRLAGQLDAVEAKLEERLRWISSTPTIAPVKGILTSGFGYRSDPLTHGRGVHQGVDIAAGPGQAVRASADGIVLRAGVIGGLGKAVHLAHGFGLGTRYGHLSRIDVRPGQRVHRGDVLGLVGNTGRSTGYHLHYEVRVDGAPVNPLGYILDGANGP